MFRIRSIWTGALCLFAWAGLLGCEGFGRSSDAASPFLWRDQPGSQIDLLHQGRPLLRYLYAFDDSTPERREATYKPYHHVLDPAGRRTITKGPGGLYTHHRGLMIGWMRLTWAGKEYDFWTMGRGDAQIHRAFLEQTALPDRATAASRIDWVTADGMMLIEETRSVTVHAPDERAYFTADFVIDLKAVNGPVDLNGDPEHAGFQFRPTQDVAEQTQDGRGRAHYTFHREDIDPQVHQNLPWAVATYDFEGRTYHVQHMTHPDDPRPWVYSAYRDYGRFGSYFKRTIPNGETLRLRYRIRVVEGEAPTRDQWQGAYEAYVTEE